MNNRLDPKKLVEFTSQIKNESIFPESLGKLRKSIERLPIPQQYYLQMK